MARPVHCDRDKYRRHDANRNKHRHAYHHGDSDSQRDDLYQHALPYSFIGNPHGDKSVSHGDGEPDSAADGIVLAYCQQRLEPLDSGALLDLGVPVDRMRRPAPRDRSILRICKTCISGLEAHSQQEAAEVEASTRNEDVTTGLDLGDKRCHACVLDADGGVIDRRTVATNRQRLASVFAALQTSQHGHRPRAAKPVRLRHESSIMILRCSSATTSVVARALGLAITAGVTLMVGAANGQAAALPLAGLLSGKWYVAEQFDDVNFRALDMASPDHGWAGTTRGELFHYTGSEWRLSSARAPSSVRAIDMHSSDRGWAVGGSIQSGYVLEYLNGLWRQIEGLDVPILLGVTAVSEDEAWAVGFSGTLLHGKTHNWVEVEVPTDEPLPNLYDIDISAPGQGWAVGSRGVILEYVDETWRVHRRPVQGNDGILSVFALSATQAWAAGSGGTILAYRNGAWAEDYSPTNQQLLDIDMLSPSDGWIVGGLGSIGEILLYRNGRWARQSSTVGQGIRAVSMLSAGEAWAAAYGGAILHYELPGLVPRSFFPLAHVD